MPEIGREGEKKVRKEGRRGTIKRDWKGREANSGRVERDLIQGVVTTRSTSGRGTEPSNPRTHTHAATKRQQTYEARHSEKAYRYSIP